MVRLMPKASEEQAACRALSFSASRHQDQGQGQGQDQDQGQGGRKDGSRWGSAGLGLLGAGLVGLASSPFVLSAEEKKKLVAEEKKKSSKLVFGKTAEDRIRQYATADNVFDHFASYQLVSDTGGECINLKQYLHDFAKHMNHYHYRSPG